MSLLFSSATGVFQTFRCSRHCTIGALALGMLLATAADGIDLELAAPRPEPLAPPQLMMEADLPPAAPSYPQLPAALAGGGDLDAAAMLAQQMLDATAAAYGEKDGRAAVALVNLATVHERQGRYDAAIGEYRQALDRLQDQAGLRDPRQITPWYGLGLSYFQTGDYADAAAAFQNALQLHRMSYGLFRLGQLDFYAALARTYLALGRQRDADNYQIRRLTTAIRVLGADNPKLVPVIQAVARWYHDSGRHVVEHVLYSDIVKLLQHAHAPDEPKLFEFLIATARSALEAPQVSAGIGVREARSMASEILHRPADGSATPPAVQARQWLELGDLYFQTGDHEQALQSYRRAATLLDASGSQAAEAAFGRPVLLSMAPLFSPPPVHSGAPSGFVEVEFTVTDDGRAADLKVLRSGPPGSPAVTDKAAKLVRALRDALFRPRILNGEPQRTEHVDYRYTFDVPVQK
ncbi:MAG: tetratricopeptide repeat protein [Gammaproteobacteria bacterium]|nr:tetratricopeptide repeat protein [Gammaproteobacteria bacterium]